ncbi:hypothetical protein RB2654_13995 [Rhodobacterales bacterium HTCC2654]|uniref:Uncharacterized protein n=1 Tax=Maritimibacter alkaliphilus HTCC2654 TaxID=314271 RepID=A3VGJ8_9RHOB|nr:hypothetical protein RB2654_13995 [Rhodobacterales bacterium HTCC2654] [Maritimibacter alkaliphilus HTCC2654]
MTLPNPRARGAFLPCVELLPLLLHTRAHRRQNSRPSCRPAISRTSQAHLRNARSRRFARSARLFSGKCRHATANRPGATCGRSPHRC